MSERLGFSSLRASTYVRALLGRLTRDFFVSRRLLCFPGMKPRMTDIYGHRDPYGSWFIKFYIASGQLIVTSCHEPEDVLTCASGIRLVTRS